MDRPSPETLRATVASHHKRLLASETSDKARVDRQSASPEEAKWRKSPRRKLI